MTDDEILSTLSSAFPPIRLRRDRFEVRFEWKGSAEINVHELEFRRDQLHGELLNSIDAADLRAAEVERLRAFAEASARCRRFFHKTSGRTVLPKDFFFPAALRRPELTSIDDFEGAILFPDGLRSELERENVVLKLRGEFPAAAACLDGPADMLLAETLLDEWGPRYSEKGALKALDALLEADRRSLAPLLVAFLDIRTRKTPFDASKERKAYQVLKAWGALPKDPRDRWGSIAEEAPEPRESARAEILGALEPWVRTFQRSAWVPKVAYRQELVEDSKFGGTALVTDRDPWPDCGRCKKPLPLFLQLDVAKLPSGSWRGESSGFLQLFYCTKCEDGYEPFSPSHVTRLVQNGTRIDPPAGVKRFRAKKIDGWNKCDDYPRVTELERLGLVLEYDFGRGSVRVTCDPIALASDVSMKSFQAEAISDTFKCAGEDKLGGWPCWIQGVTYPRCTECGTEMEHVFEFTGDHVKFMLGDEGIGRITRCPKHEGVLTFSWECH